jgi:hypothetical protein
MHELKGGCHCGTIAVTYHTEIAPEDAKPRACQCTFCRKHSTRAVSDPKGSLDIAIADAGAVSRYKFGLGTVDFLVCRKCGVYVAAFMADPDDSKGYATLMANALDAQARYSAAAPAVYEGETGTDRATRRRKLWTPARLRVGT